MDLIIKLIAEVQAFTLLSVRAFTNLFHRPRYLKDTFQQMDEVGVKSTAIVVLTGFFTGGVLALQSAGALKDFGAVNLTGQLVAVSLVKELGPVFTALIVAGRVGSGIASQVGRPELTYYFGIIESKEINAFACPGGYVFISAYNLKPWRMFTGSIQAYGEILHNNFDQGFAIYRHVDFSF